MSSAPRGRHRVARHAAPKKKVASHHVGTLFGLAGVSSVVMASGSTVAGVVQTGDISVMEYPVSTVTASDAQPNQLSVQAGTTRAQAASRTEDRKTLEDVQDLVAAGFGFFV